jgi:hypothetical protein
MTCSAGRMPSWISFRMTWALTPSDTVASAMVNHSPSFSAER